MVTFFEQHHCIFYFSQCGYCRRACSGKILVDCAARTKYTQNVLIWSCQLNLTALSAPKTLCQKRAGGKKRRWQRINTDYEHWVQAWGINPVYIRYIPGIYQQTGPTRPGVVNQSKTGPRPITVVFIGNTGLKPYGFLYPGSTTCTPPWM